MKRVKAILGIIWVAILLLIILFYCGWLAAWNIEMISAQRSGRVLSESQYAALLTRQECIDLIGGR